MWNSCKSHRLSAKAQFLNDIQHSALINNGNAIQANAMKEANQRDKEAEKQIEEINGRIKNKVFTRLSTSFDEK